MNIFIVYAHPEPQSFNGSLLRFAEQTLTEAGHTVQVSDLYAMDWQPVSDRRNFTTEENADYFKQQEEELYATEHGGFAPDVQAEIEKLIWCEALILQFPLWWFSMPAVLKGWIDRVFALGVAYGGGKWYDKGVFRGKRGLLSLTTGGPETMYSPTGINGHMDALLYPINHGILHFTGFDVLPPFVVWGPARASDDERANYFKSYRERLLSLEITIPLSYPPLAAFNMKTFMLKSSED